MVIERAISMSLFNAFPKYCVGAIRNCIIAPHVFEDWKVIVHYDHTVPPAVIEECRKYGAECIDCSKWGIRDGKFWRFLIADTAERWICRDADGRLSVRDLVAVEEWEKSGKKWHVIRDVVSAIPKVVLAGLWGGYKTDVHMRDLVKAWKFSMQYGDDELFLREKLWPQMKPDTFLHSIEDGEKPVPRKRPGFYYLAQVWDEHEQRI